MAKKTTITVICVNVLGTIESPENQDKISLEQLPTLTKGAIVHRLSIRIA